MKKILAWSIIVMVITFMAYILWPIIVISIPCMIIGWAYGQIIPKHYDDGRKY